MKKKRRNRRDLDMAKNATNKLRGSTKRFKYENANSLLPEHRRRLTRLLRRAFDEHNWRDSAAALSLLVQSTPFGVLSYPISDCRKNFLAAIELLSRVGETQNHQTKVKQICEIWMSKLKWSSKCPKERVSIHLELAVFFVMRGNFKEVLHITKFLLQDQESAKEPKVHLLHGLASYHIWYSELPTEMQLKDTTDLHRPSQRTIAAPANSDCLDNHDKTSDSHCSREEQVDLSIDSKRESSVDNYKVVLIGNKYRKKEAHQNFTTNVPSVEGSAFASSYENKIKFLIEDKHLQEFSIFAQHGECLDAILLPLALMAQETDIDQSILAHKELLDENYNNAVTHLRTALYSKPPLLAALLPLTQVLLLGDRVEEALSELRNLCQLSDTTLPFRLRSKILESFCSNHSIEISNCHEAIILKDPTCSYSVERLINMFKDGNYSITNLLEMICSHLDVADGNCSIWDAFASCLLAMHNSPQCNPRKDQISANISNQSYLQSCSSLFPFSSQVGKRPWSLRGRWWSKRHFSKKTFLWEMQAGSWQLLTFKAACGYHLYGSCSQYVEDVLLYLREKGDGISMSFLETHRKSCLDVFGALPNA